MMAYMMPGNSFGDMLVRKDIENAPAPEVVRAWSTVDYNPEFKRFEITKESDDTMSILVDNLKLPKEEKPSVRIFAEMIRYGYENKWTSFIESDDSWKTKPIFDTITKSYGGKTGSIGLTHKQKNDIIRAVNQEKHPSYGNKTLKRALYEEMEFGYPSLPELKRYDKNARMELIDKMIADYSLLGKEKYMEAFQELEESIKYEATIER